MNLLRNPRALLKPHRLLPLIDLVCCAVVLVLLVADLIWPRRILFLERGVKVFLLITCLLSALCGGMLVARQRAAMRRAAAPRRR